MNDVPISGLFVAALIFRKYEWKERCLIFFSAMFFES
jgi:hypothetical protein